MKEESAITATPVNLSVYPANAVFKNGSQLAAGEYVVYAGTGNSVTITGLSQKTYHYSVFEYNGVSAPVYNTTALTGFASVGSTLPVNVEYFVAREKDGKVILDWATSQEINNEHFVVERSKDGSNFQSIKIIKGAGNSNAKLEYSYTDDLINNAEKVYYRLKQVDIDGRYMYSKIVVVNIPQSKNSISVYPNPVQDHFTIKLPASITQATVILYNNNGAVLITQKINTTKQFGVRHLPDGVYYISVQYADKKYQHTLIKH